MSRWRAAYNSAMSAVALPEYCCAILSDPRGWLWLQLRPPTARVAADQLTCFGGRREEGEDAEECLHRELDEELGWRPSTLQPRCELWKGPRLIARFFAVSPAPVRAALHVEAGSCALAAPWQALPGLPVSPWHALVLAAVRAGTTRVDL